MLRRLVDAVTFASLAVVVAACGSEPSDEPERAEAPIAAAQPFVLVPTTRDVSRACAGELGATYCSDAEAALAAARCRARLDRAAASDCRGGECTLAYAAVRTTCEAGPTYPTRAACDTPRPDDCSFYRSCLESTHSCGDDGYALAYGERLCYAFIENRGEFSPLGQRWLREVRSCLQRELVPILHAPATCASVEDDAYATHPGCYTATDNSICSLPPRDVLELARILGEDLFSARAVKQIHEVAGTCVTRLRRVESSSDRRGFRFFGALQAASVDGESLREFVARHRGGVAAGWAQ